MGAQGTNPRSARDAMRDRSWSQWRNNTQERFVSISNLNQLRSTRANLPCSSGSANVKRLRTHYKAPPCGGGDDSTNLAMGSEVRCAISMVGGGSGVDISILPAPTISIAACARRVRRSRGETHRFGTTKACTLVQLLLTSPGLSRWRRTRGLPTALHAWAQMDTLLVNAGAEPRIQLSPVNSHNEWDPLEEIIVGRLEGATMPSDHPVVTCNIPNGAAGGHHEADDARSQGSAHRRHARHRRALPARPRSGSYAVGGRTGRSRRHNLGRIGTAGPRGAHLSDATDRCQRRGAGLRDDRDSKTALGGQVSWS
jgi:hypothetical protein